MSQEESESRSKRIGLPLAPIEQIIATIDSIRAKGGHASLDVIKTTLGKSTGMTNWATSAAAALGLVSTEGEDYTLTILGDKFAAATEEERTRILKEAVLRYEPYHTILLRLRNAVNKTLSKSDITKAWYDLYKSGTDRTRELYTGSFASICARSRIIENRKKTVVLSDEGEALLEGTTVMEQSVKATSEVAAEPLSTVISRKSEPSISIPLTATLSINIVVDIKEEDSVRNLLRIIGALKGENVDSQT